MYSKQCLSLNLYYRIGESGLPELNILILVVCDVTPCSLERQYRCVGINHILLPQRG